eukprot:4526044-Alexandrium_andersonii.AAC.1
MAVGLFSLLPTGPSVKKLLASRGQGASPGELPTPRTPSTGASGASGLAGGATAPRTHPNAPPAR